MTFLITTSWVEARYLKNLLKLLWHVRLLLNEIKTSYIIIQIVKLMGALRAGIESFFDFGFRGQWPLLKFGKKKLVRY